MKHTRRVIRILCIVTAVALAAGIIWDFSVQLQRALTKETYRTLLDVSEDYNKAFTNSIDNNIKTMNVLADGLIEMKSRTREDVTRVLQNAVADGGFSKMAVSNAQGETCSNLGESINISTREYFQKAMRGEVNVSQPLTTAVDKEKVIIIAVPIHKKTEISGVLFGVYPLSTAGSQLLNFTYYGEGYGFVISPDGTILLSSDHTDKLANEENIFSFFEKTQLTEYSVEKIKSVIVNRKRGRFNFSYLGQTRLVSFMPSTVNDWYTFSIASNTSMLLQKEITNQFVAVMVLKLMGIVALLLLWLILHNRRHNKEMREANQKYQSLIAHINGGLIVAAYAKIPEGSIVSYVSPGFTEMTGYTLEDIQTLCGGQYLNVIAKEDREKTFESHLEQLKTGNTYQMSYRIRKKDGTYLWVMDNGFLVEDGDGLHNHTIVTDITEIKKQEEALRISEERFSMAINASSGTLFEVDLKKQVYTHFENAKRIFGVSAEKLLADTAAFSSLPYGEFEDAVTDYFFHPDDRITSKNAMNILRKNKKISYEARLRRADNTYIWVRIDLTLIADESGMPQRMIGFMSDIDAVKQQAEILEEKLQIDPMTKLYNKVAMARLSNKMLKDSTGGLHAMIVLDIDNFKGINDTLGHTFGDVVLMDVATKLKTLFRSDDIVGRMGGDEFAVLMKNMPDASSVLKKATELSSTFHQTYAGEKGNYMISCSMGVILIADRGETFETVYRKADAALYKAKQNGRDQFVLYQEKDAADYPIVNTRTNDEKMEHLQESHNMEAHIFELLYASKDFDVSINMAITAIGRQYHVNRVAIFENDDEMQTTTNIYEWCNDGISSEIGNLQQIPLSSNGESILDSFDKNGLLYCKDVRELSPYIRNILEKQGIRSSLKITIVNEQKIYGFIGFDECTEYRTWTAEEIEKLSYLSKVLSVFLFKKNIEATVLENLNTRLEILDVLPDYISVVNPETHCLEYANRKMQTLLPTAHPGAFCFSTLRGGQSEPCRTCIVEKIKQGDTDNLEIVSADQKLHLKVNALTIRWTNDQRRVLLYGNMLESDKKD
ncbi:MAG: diguanylate cyclase [Oscillospiraceae bacterium]